jgi:hypothetical protein
MFGLPPSAERLVLGGNIARLLARRLNSSDFTRTAQGFAESRAVALAPRDTEPPRPRAVWV